MKTRLLKKLRKEAYKTYGMETRDLCGEISFGIGERSGYDLSSVFVDKCYFTIDKAIHALRKRRRDYILKMVSDMKKARFNEYLRKM